MNRIKELREAAGLSQRELARRLGCNGTDVHRIEHGQRRLNAEMLTKLSEVFNVPSDEIIGAAPKASRELEGQAAILARLDRIERMLEQVLRKRVA